MKQKLHGAIHSFFPHDHHVPQHPVAKSCVVILGIVGLFSMYLGSIGQNPVDAANLCDRPMCNDINDQPRTRQIQTSVLNAAGAFSLGYYEYLPKSYATQTAKRFPVIIFLHGVGEGGNGTTELSRVLAWGPPSYINRGFNFTFNVNGVDESFIVLSPQAPGGWFNPTQVDSLIEWAKSRYRVDTERIYLMGLSAGGGGTWRYASNKVEYAQKLAAIAPTCGADRPNTTTTNPNEIRDPKYIADANLPVWAFHGDADGTVSVNASRQRISAINQHKPGLSMLTEYPGVSHNSWSLSMDPTHNVENPNVYEWFLQQKRSTTGSTNLYPSANAGADKVVSLPVTVSLDGSLSSDKDGTIASYARKQVSGPSTTTLATPSSAKTSVSNLVNGTYVFSLTIKDDKGAMSIDTVSIMVKNKPVLVMGTNKVITLPNNSATLDVVSANDADGWVVSNLRSQVSGPNTATIVTPTSFWGQVSNLVAGTYVFRLTATDNDGLIGYGEVTVTVVGAGTTPVNQIPTANAGADQTITLPTSSATLDSSLSKDTDGSITTYLWKQISGPTTAVIATTTASKTTLSSLVAGTYIFEVTVGDNSGATAKDQVSVIVKPATTVITPPTPTPSTNKLPTIVAGTDKTITLPTSTALLDAISSSDADGWIKGNKWSQVSGPNTATIATPTTFWTQVSNLIAGTYVFRVAAIDDKGGEGYDDITVKVNPSTTVTTPPTPTPSTNKLPTIVAGTDKTITLPTSTVLLDAISSSDADGWIKGNRWSQVSGPNTATIATPTTFWTQVSNLIAGTYVFRVAAIDDKGGEGYDDITVTVNSSTTVTTPATPSPSTNKLPTVIAGTDKTITLPTSTVLLDAISSSDADGWIKGNRWSQVSGPSTATIVTPTTFWTHVNNLVAGTYIFRITAFDDKGGEGYDDITVTVK